MTVEKEHCEHHICKCLSDEKAELKKENNKLRKHAAALEAQLNVVRDFKRLEKAVNDMQDIVRQNCDVVEH